MTGKDRHMRECHGGGVDDEGNRDGDGNEQDGIAASIKEIYLNLVSKADDVLLLHPRVPA